MPRVHLQLEGPTTEPGESYKADKDHIFETHKIDMHDDGKNENRSQQCDVPDLTSEMRMRIVCTAVCAPMAIREFVAVPGTNPSS